ncbi:holin family protein [Thioclava sp. DLFJ4-1]|uniref:holin family protein n=1 Tax=Thioclava sp. DLFJ4-1 TaxID=1915313 RepID=UPI0009980812|nr:holin family protein [Thioclava sp. DLFJ4-1]OOY15295.1 methionine synthase I [Thioclava sp. DLFJ4-1]
MGVIEKLLGGAGAVKAAGEAASSVAEVFVPNATKKLEAAQVAYLAALQEHGAEFEFFRPGRFDRIVNGLNRLPRPVLAFGIVGLFVYAMLNPVGFAQRMVGLGYVPEPLWWLLGAVVSFYFGAREAHYFRMKKVPAVPPAALAATSSEENAALSAWRAGEKPAG